MASERTVIDWAHFSGGRYGIDAYCRYQERATSRLVVDEDEKPFESAEPEHIAAVRAYIAKKNEQEPA
jgi:hypothetical protein